MIHEWYKDEKKVIELAEFMVDVDQITTADELLEYIKYPDRYTEVWELYQEEILGKYPSILNNNDRTVLPVMLALANSSE